MKNYTKILGFLAIVFSCIFTYNVNALSVDSGEYPDIPAGLQNALIVDNSSFGTGVVLYGTEQVDANSWVAYDSKYVLYNSNSSEEVNTGVTVKYYILDSQNEEWNAQNDLSCNENYCADRVENSNPIYSASPIYDWQDPTEELYPAGYGLGIQTLFGGTTSTIAAILTGLLTVTTALLGNEIFQLVIGVAVLFIVISIIYNLATEFYDMGHPNSKSARRRQARFDRKVAKWEKKGYIK